MIGDSAINSVKKPAVSPFRSRSTIICLACIGALLVLACIIMESGYFDAGFGTACIIMLREISSHALNHQSRADEKATKDKPTT